MVNCGGSCVKVEGRFAKDGELTMQETTAAINDIFRDNLSWRKLRGIGNNSVALTSPLPNMEAWEQTYLRAQNKVQKTGFQCSIDFFPLLPVFLILFATDLTAFPSIHSFIQWFQQESIQPIAWAIGTHIHLAHYGPPNHCGVTGSSGHLKTLWVSRRSRRGSQVAPIMAIRRSPPLKLRQWSVSLPWLWPLKRVHLLIEAVTCEVAPIMVVREHSTLNLGSCLQSWPDYGC